MDETMKVFSVMCVMRSLPIERSEAREVLKLATSLVELHGQDTLRPPPPAARKKRKAA